jgi:hypothetical protein
MNSKETALEVTREMVELQKIGIYISPDAIEYASHPSNFEGSEARGSRDITHVTDVIIAWWK